MSVETATRREIAGAAFLAILSLAAFSLAGFVAWASTTITAATAGFVLFLVFVGLGTARAASDTLGSELAGFPIARSRGLWWFMAGATLTVTGLALVVRSSTFAETSVSAFVVACGLALVVLIETTVDTSSSSEVSHG